MVSGTGGSTRPDPVVVLDLWALPRTRRRSTSPAPRGGLWPGTRRAPARTWRRSARSLLANWQGEAAEGYRLPLRSG